MSAPATKSLLPISFFALGAAPPPKATRPAPVIGFGARCPSRLAAPSVVMPPTYCMASIRATIDRFAGRMISSDVSLWHRSDVLIRIERVRSLALSGRAYMGAELARLTRSLQLEASGKFEQSVILVQASIRFLFALFAGAQYRLRRATSRAGDATSGANN